MLFRVAETKLLQDSNSVHCPITVWDHPHRSLVVVLDEEPSLYLSLKSPHPELFEGVHYEGGVIRVFGSTLVHGPKRALVVVLDEPPSLPKSTLPPGVEPPTYPMQVGDLLMDMEDVNEIEDGGDYVYVGFSPQHQPPFLFLTGDKADEISKLGLVPDQTSHQYLSEGELQSIAHDAENQAPDLAQSISRLVADIHALRSSRAELLGTAGRMLQNQLDEAELLVEKLAAGKIGRIRCGRSPECHVRIDGSCSCTDYQ